MDKHKKKYCPKCNKAFICNMRDVKNCQCNTVVISEATRDFLSHTYFGCLCKDCLLKINQDVQLAKSYQFPTQGETLVEGLHYYKEGNNFVFTELYHLLRGYCCKSNCRHCVYGFKKIKI